MSQPMFYMARPEEISKQPDAVTMLSEIAAASEDKQNVWLALWSFWNFEHAFDDILDAGVLTGDEKIELLRQSFEFLTAALTEPEMPLAAIRFKESYLAALERTPMTDETKALAEAALDEFAGNLIANPFYQQHTRAHLAMLHSMIFRAISGDEMALNLKAEVRALSPAVRCGDVDFIVHCAKLAGGWELALKVTRLRDYDT